jgi:hypothetical protein
MAMSPGGARLLAVLEDLAFAIVTFNSILKTTISSSQQQTQTCQLERDQQALLIQLRNFINWPK